jgi:hypothetical protein
MLLSVVHVNHHVPGENSSIIHAFYIAKHKLNHTYCMSTHTIIQKHGTISTHTIIQKHGTISTHTIIQKHHPFYTYRHPFYTYHHPKDVYGHEGEM